MQVIHDKLDLVLPAPPGLAAPTAITTGVRARPKVIESDTPRSNLSKVDEGPSKTVLQAAQDVCDHLARMASRVSDLFDEFDVDKNGLINKKEFRTACVSLGMTYPTAVLDQVFDLMDEDGSSQLEHNEVVRKARRAAFERGFVPKRAPLPPAHQRRLDAYWARRNRMHVEAHEQSVAERVRREEARREQAIEEHRQDRMSMLRSKRDQNRQQGLSRQERYWLRRKMEEAHEHKVQQALEETVNAPVLFLPALPEAKAIAKATWAKDPTAPRRAVEREESIREVAQLQDVWVGSIIEKWKAPTAETKAISALKGGLGRKKGRAPNADAFRGMRASTPRA